MRNKKEIKIGNVLIGGKNNIAIQSMTTTKTIDYKSTVKQINDLENAGCEIVRITVPDIESAEVIDKIKEKISIPLVADIHFDYKIALKCIERGIDKVRINPGNIGETDKVKMIANAAKAKNIPIRIGVNSGSVEKKLLEKYGGATADALIESALNEIKILENVDFDDIVLSIKASDVLKTIEVYKRIDEIVNYPLHIGVTESGTEFSGLIKSSMGLGNLLINDIGDTIRVSLTSDPVNEIYAAKEILNCVGKYENKVQLVSCPTCGRCNYNLIEIANEIEKRIRNINKKVKIAVMGCAVNGPGEAKDADIGIAGGASECLLFKKGIPERKVPFENVVDVLIDEINKFEVK